MLLLLVVFLCIFLWGCSPVLTEVAKQTPREPLNSIKNRFAVDSYIWSDAAPRALRRRYVLAGACMSAAMLCLASLAGNSAPQSDRQVVGVVLCLIAAAVIAVDLVRKIIRHGL